MPSPSNSKETEDLINSLKTNLCVWEDLVAKSVKFHNSIKLMTQSSSDLLDSLHSVCDIASKSSCCLKSTGINLTKLVLREKKIEQRVSTLNNHLNENLSTELEKLLIEWRKTSMALKRERDHDWKKANIEYQKSLSEVERTEKKLRKKNAGKVGLSETASLQIEYANQDAQNKRRYVEELERSAMRRAAIEERQRFKQFLGLLKPILDCQLSMREDLDNLEEVISHLYGEKSENLDEFPEELEQNIQEHHMDSRCAPIPRSYSTLSKQKGLSSNGSHGSHSSLNSNTMSTTSSEWNNNNVLINACMEMSSRLNENMSNISAESSIKSEKMLSSISDTNSNHDENMSYSWDRTLTHKITESPNNLTQQPIDSDTECSSSEDDNDASSDHNSQDGIINNSSEVFPLPEQQSHDNEAPFELPLDYQDNLPPPPSTAHQITSIPPMTSVPQSHYQLPVTMSSDNLYPNQSIPPPIYSNLHELKMNAAKKFGANTLSRMTYKDRSNILQGYGDCTDIVNDEASTSFLGSNITCSATDKDKQILKTTQNDPASRSTIKNPEIYSRPQPPPPVNNNDDITTSYGFYAETESVVTATKIPLKGDSTLKPSMLRRGSFTTEMQVPQTPKNYGTTRRPSNQERTPINMYSNKNRGRSMSVTREGSHDEDASERTSEDFNAIRQRIVNRINGQNQPPTFSKQEATKKQTPSTNYAAYEYSNTLSSPLTLRSNRFFNERIMKQTIPSPAAPNQNLSMKYHHPRGAGEHDHDFESAAGEEPANNDFNMSSPEMSDISAILADRKDDKFKHQLIQMLQASKSQEAARNSQVPVIQQTQNVSSFYHNNPSHNKPRTKSTTTQNSKYCY